MANDLRDPELYKTAGLAAVLAVIGSAVTVLFIKVFELATDLVWTDLPKALNVDSHLWYFVIPVCTVGGAVVGAARHFLGEWPRSLEDSLAKFKAERIFDYTHLGQAIVIAVISLAFGAALGPEAALTAIIGGVCSWIGKVIKTNRDGRDTMTYLGLVGALGALFGTAGAAALPLSDPEEEKTRRLWLFFPGLVAALAGWWVFKTFSGSSGYLNFTYPPYTFEMVDLVKSLLPMLAGVALAVLMLAGGQATDTLFERVPNKVIQNTIGGLLLGVLGAVTFYALFSGHEGIQPLIDDPTASAGYLLSLALIKVLAVCVCLSSGWKGGRFFPIMFAGTAIGLAVSAGVTSIPSVVGLCAAMTGAVAALLRRPIPAVVLMLFLFPVDLYPIVIFTGILGGIIGKRLVLRFPSLAPDDTAADAPEQPDSTASP